MGDGGEISVAVLLTRVGAEGEEVGESSGD
jgi:hypothetical protein